VSADLDEDRAEETLDRLRRVCPHCGEAARTLGSQCPSCGRSYEKRGLADRLPGDDFWFYTLFSPRLAIPLLIALGYLIYLIATGQTGDLI
jgi:ribosomal protein S27AE